MKNRTRKLRKWIKVEGREAAEPLSPSASASPAPGSSPPPVALPGAEAASQSVVSKTLRPARKTAPKRRPSPKSRAQARRTQRSSRSAAAKPKPAVRGKTIKSPATAPAAAAKPAAGGDGSGETRAGAVNYQVLFDNNTANISKDGESILGRVSDTMHYYPLDNINLVGYSYTGESDPEKLAVRRAQMVSQLLVERHGMARERIQVDTKTVDYQTAKVEIYIVAGGQ
jgi:outer membrane protein OmpA-like peptidoglycan-associated protein